MRGDRVRGVQEGAAALHRATERIRIENIADENFEAVAHIDQVAEISVRANKSARWVTAVDQRAYDP